MIATLFEAMKLSISAFMMIVVENGFISEICK